MQQFLQVTYGLHLSPLQIIYIYVCVCVYTHIYIFQVVYAFAASTF